MLEILKVEVIRLFLRLYVKEGQRKFHGSGKIHGRRAEGKENV